MSTNGHGLRSRPERMTRPIITLTTDFGVASPYVAAMKAAILRVNRDPQLIDISHGIRPHDIRQGAVVLETATTHFPAGTIHVAVVDPGVGTGRRIVYCQMGAQHYIAPDNGLLSLVARQDPCRRIVAVEDPRYWHQPVSATFHGRDIMAPVAGHLSLGLDPRQLGPACAELLDFSWPEVQSGDRHIRGVILWIDAFGNLVTNVDAARLPAGIDPDRLHVSCRDRRCETWVACYGHAVPGTLVALIGSSNRLEIAIGNGNAARELGAREDDPVDIRWPNGN